MELKYVLDSISHPRVLVIFQTEAWYKETFDSINDFFGNEVEKSGRAHSGGYIQVMDGPRFDFMRPAMVRGHKGNFAITEGNLHGRDINDEYIRHCCLLPPHYFSVPDTEEAASNDDCDDF